MKPVMTYDVYQTVADRHLIKPFACVTKVGAKRIFAAADKILKAGLGELQEAVAA